MDSFEPFVSVIVPTRNEEKYIGTCLHSFVNQTYPKSRYEVLVVDGLSTDSTVDIVSSFEGKLNLRIMKNPEVKQVFALNCGIKDSKGDYFVIIGGHSFVERDFLEKSSKTFCEIKEKEPMLAAVGGSLKMVCENRFSNLVSSLYASPFSGSSSFWYANNPSFAKTVVFGFYEKKIIESINGFDEDMGRGEDFEINLRLNKIGYRLFYDPKIKTCYYVRSTLSGFVRQTFGNGAAKGVCIKKGYFNPVWFVPSIFVFYQLILLASFLLASFWAIVFSSPFIAYWVVNVLFSIKVSKKKTQFLLLPFMFWVLHVITGMGFVGGLLFGKRSTQTL